jgi:hypothetical protein
LNDSSRSQPTLKERQITVSKVTVCPLSLVRLHQNNQRGGGFNGGI